jgi:transposase
VAHRDARTTLYARHLMVQRHQASWPAADIAEQLAVSHATVHKWLSRHHGGQLGRPGRRARGRQSQADERRYLRLRTFVTGEATAEARVDAHRDRRAGDRAVSAWARDNAATLRALAGQVTALRGLSVEARRCAERLAIALDADAADLLSPMAAVRSHLTGRHQGLADQLAVIGKRSEQLRSDAAHRRRPTPP